MTISSSQELFNQDTPYYKAVMDRAGHEERLMFKVMEDVMEKSKQRFYMVQTSLEQQYQNKCQWQVYLTGQVTFLQIIPLALHLQHQ